MRDGRVRVRTGERKRRRRTVIVVADLFLVLALRVDDDFGNEASEDVFEELRGEDHLREVMTLLENLEDVA